MQIALSLVEQVSESGTGDRQGLSSGWITAIRSSRLYNVGYLAAVPGGLPLARFIDVCDSVFQLSRCGFL